MSNKLKDIYFGVVLLSFALLIIVKWHEIKDIFSLFNADNSLFLFLAIITQLFTYIVSALSYQGIIHMMHIRIPFLFLFKSSLAMLSLNQVIPSLGFSGGAFFVSKAKRFGISVGKSTLAIILESIIFYSGFIVLLFLSILYLLMGHRVNSLHILLSLIFGIIVLLGVIYFFYIIKHKEKLSNFAYKIYCLVTKILRKKQDKKGFDFLVSEFFLGKSLMGHNKKRIITPFIYLMLKTVFDVLTIYFIFLSFGYP